MQFNQSGFWRGASITGVMLLSLPIQKAVAVSMYLTGQVQAPTTVQVLAQTPDPNRDRLIQPAPIPTPVPTEPSKPVLQTPTTPTPHPAPPTLVNIPVTKIDVTGSTVFHAADWLTIIQPLEGRLVSLEELQRAADAITQLYLDRGYITSRAILVDQTVTNGVVQIQVVEGSLEQIKLEGNRHVRESYIRSRIALGTKPPLNRDSLEDQLRLLKLDPLFTNVEASLRSGNQLGTSILTVRVTEAPSFNGLVGVDNYSPPAVGSVRMGGELHYRNLTGFGDELSASYFRTTAGGANMYDFSYRLPVNAMNGTLQLRIAPNDNRIIDPAFKDLGIEGNSQLYEISFRQPLLRTPREEFALSLGFTVQDGQTFIFNNIGAPFGVGPDINGNSRTRVLKLGQDYVKRDPQGAWALRSQFSFGIDIFDATVNPSPIPDGRFFSWLAQAQRVQRLSNDQLLIVQGDLQLTPDSLLPSQQFVIGGGQSLRGFRQNVRSGDNGFRLSAEDRITIQRDESGISVMQLAPFIDIGNVWNKSDNPNNPLPAQTFLAGVGLGFLWQPHPQFNLRLDYGIPLINLRDRGNDVQDSGFYFSLFYHF